MPRSLALSAGSLVALFLCAAGERAEGPERLIVQPPALELNGRQARHRILVTAEAAAGSLSDGTASTTYRSQDARVAAVSADGECQAQGDGSTHLTVT